MPNLRWLIIVLVFLATLINFIDRLTVSVLAPTICDQLHLSNIQYAQIGTWFLIAYTLSHGLSGKLYDKIGTRRGFSLSITVWSLAAMAHAFVRSFAGLCTCRVFLGLGEAGNWPGAAKVIAEWFPIRERAFAMGIFNSGTCLGSVIAFPLITFLQLQFGWQSAFLFTGALGFLWLIAWLCVYRPLAVHPWVTQREVDYILADQPVSQTADTNNPSRWRDLMQFPQTWAIILSRLFVDPVWWLYVLWLPKYLADTRHWTLQDIGAFAWVPFLSADAGSLLGGYLSGHLIHRRNWSVDRARKTIIIAASFLMLAGIPAAYASDTTSLLFYISLVTFGFQAWINNVQTLPSDLFPQRAVATVAGMGGVGAGIGSILYTTATGYIVQYISYKPVLIIASLLTFVGTLLLFALLGKIRTLPLSPR
jgi:ACS family hexuronate transporter-like MFS transporter